MSSSTNRTHHHTSSARTSRGAEVWGGKEPISKRKNLPIECLQGNLARCPNRIFACTSLQPLLVVHDMMSRNQPHCLTSRHLTTNHITSSHLANNSMTSYHIMLQHTHITHVVWCDVMWCHVAKHNGATPFMFDSRNTGNCQSSAQSNRSDAKRNGTKYNYDIYVW